MFEGYHETYNEEARLVLLRALADQTDYRANDSLLVAILQGFAINRGRDFVRAQLSWLETEAGAIRLDVRGDTAIAEICEAGLDHVERRRTLPGVKRMSPSRR